MSVVLSEHLPLLAAAPHGIQKLRDLILGLAIIGKLTDADTRHWQPATFDDLGEWGSGGTPLKAHADYYGGNIPWLVIGDLNDGVVTSAETHITQKGLVNSSAKLVPPGTLLIAMYGSIGKLGIAGIGCATNQAIAHCRINSSKVECRFLFYFVRAIRSRLLASGQGLAQQNISQKILKATPLQLPPLAEQHRIVAKVDELMALCDRLEAEVGAGGAAHAKLVETLLGTLTQSSDAADLAANWQRLAEHFDTLFTTESSLDALKQTILQLAAMGKLVPQEPNDEPTSELLKRIAKERAKLEAEGKIKKSKPVSPIGVEEQPFSIPCEWMWVPLGAIVDVKGGKRVANGYQLSKTPTPFVYIRVSDMKNGSIDDSDLHYIDADMRRVIERYIIKKDDIYMTIVGATIGKCGLVPEKFDGMNLTENAARLIVSPAADRVYLYKCLASDFCQKQFIDKTKQVGVQKMALNRLAMATIPLPPLAEQHRIVAKVDELMALCDRLKTDLAESRIRQARLSATLIETALQAA